MTKGTCPHGEFDLLEGCPQCMEERQVAKSAPPISIVKVQYFSETTNELSPREYTYFSEEPLAIGDIIMVPVRDTVTKAKVMMIDVPESEIADFRDKVKTIPKRIADSEFRGKPMAEGDAIINEATITLSCDNKINLCDTCNLSVEFPTCMPETIGFGDGHGNDNIIKCSNYEVEIFTDIVEYKPGEDAELRIHHADALKLLEHAERRVIKTAEDLKAANDDILLITKLKKAMEAKRKEFLAPLKEQVESINATYKELMDPVFQADSITADKIRKYMIEQKRLQAEQEEINRLRIEAANKEMELKGELSESVELVEAVPEAPKSVKTDMGTTGLTDCWKYEITDLDALPREYMIPDETMLTSIAKKQHDKKQIPGVRFYNEPIITRRAK